MYPEHSSSLCLPVSFRDFASLQGSFLPASIWSLNIVPKGYEKREFFTSEMELLWSIKRYITFVSPFIYLYSTINWSRKLYFQIRKHSGRGSLRFAWKFTAVAQALFPSSLKIAQLVYLIIKVICNCRKYRQRERYIKNVKIVCNFATKRQLLLMLQFISFWIFFHANSCKHTIYHFDKIVTYCIYSFVSYFLLNINIFMV